MRPRLPFAMNYRTPAHRAAAIETVLDALDGARRAVLTTHLNADGDGVGCQAALLDLLEARGIDARLVNPTPFPDLFRFLVDDPARILGAGTPEARDWCGTSDVCLVLDTGEAQRIGRVKPMVDPLPKIVIDHHPPGDQAIQGVSFRDASASASGELVLDLAIAMGGPWSRRVVEGLYVAILTDTGSFRFSNATSGALFAAGELVGRGAQPDELYRRVYENVPMRRIELLKRTLPSLERSEDGRVAWVTVPDDAYRELGCDTADLDGLTDYPRSLAGVEVALVFRQVDDGIKVSLRSNGSVNVNALARRFGGGGHVRASGALIKGPLDEVRGEMVEATKAAVVKALQEEASAAALFGTRSER
jgi:bifunctional oligoribonuclease and PAP phosphatase NrnA